MVINPEIATRRTYLTADRQRAVFEGSEEAAFLLAGVGGTIPDAQAKRLGLLVSPPESLPPVEVENRAIKRMNKR